jgi:uncharacterized protein (DUF1501 family)
MNKRHFLQAMGSLAFRGAMPVAALAAASANISAQSNDYKALVCIFLFGGNDGYNTLVPYETNAHAQYLQFRPEYNASNAQGLGIPRNALLPLSGGSSPALMALHPAMTNTHARYLAGNAAFLKNIGPLVEPLRASEIYTKSFPSGLQGHFEQQEISMLALKDYQAAGSDKGWGMRALSATGLMNNTGFENISFSGINRWQAFPSAPTVALAPLSLLPLVHPQAMQQLVQQGQQSARPFTQTYAQLLANTYNAAGKINNIFSRSNSVYDQAFRSFSRNTATAASAQLLSIGKFIENRFELNSPVRQVFFVGLGGFDTHEKQYAGHQSLLQQLDDGLNAFFEGLKAIGMDNKVTAFTMSDFGRTLKMNASHGTDHGWASHNLVMGGAVKGGIYGQDVDWQIGSQDVYPYDPNAIIPSISIDQYGATLSQWFGVPQNKMFEVFPNLRNFSQTNLGFMNI